MVWDEMITFSEFSLDLVKAESFENKFLDKIVEPKFHKQSQIVENSVYSIFLHILCPSTA